MKPYPTPILWISALFSGWMTLLLASGLIFIPAESAMESIAGQNLALTLVCGLLLTGVSFLLNQRFPFLVISAPLVLFSLCAIIASAVQNDPLLSLTFGGILAVLLPPIFTVHFSFSPIKDKRLKLFFIGAAFLFFLYVGGFTVLRHLTFRTPCFDFGIFVQMFHQMKETGLPFTTCERNQVLSHFAVHTSPIYYLLLPAYLIFPDPATLQLGQAAVLACGAIPLWKLCRQYRLGGRSSALLALCYFSYPALAGGCFYDIHENCFLAPLLLWLFYASAQAGRRCFLGLIPGFFILLVKEDAAIYPAFWGLYLLASEFFGTKRAGIRSRLTPRFRLGLLLFFLSLVYFGIIVTLMERWGLGVMTSRYHNFSFQNGGFGEMILSVLLHPAYALAQCIQENRLIYLLEMLAPLLFLPLAGRKLEDFILLGPLALMNLMPDYVYQHTISYQYNFGTLSFLFYLAIRRLSEMEPAKRERTLYSAALVTLTLFAGTQLTHAGALADWVQNKETYQRMEADLSRIPEHASVTASSFLVSHLAERDVVYLMDQIYDTDYVAYDLRDPDPAVSVETYRKAGYQVFYQSEELILLARSSGS
ncbi:DUF2079 domain-containing protein [Cuneatibacter sp. NSJ-177]|uniref:DUF2079 domain-containing protein n=1 Tax=Cuneatibacter sp. NSJ-177 TaxID=2931401 RepID=UPI001FD5BE2D|nr:DUF2079 domain-containing protein [Cuneatibacter sp. NSJ-177]MCJ7837405.1 DUF2079 domain-containing protein [Cuneatibacter sp. NSJ-177]